MYAIERQSSGSRFSMAVLAGSIVLLAVLASVSWLLWNQLQIQQQRTWIEPRIDVVLDGNHYRLDAAQAQWLAQFTQLHFSDGEAQSLVLLEAEISRQLGLIFDGAAARLPEFADWYYSLSGEYSRLSMALLGRLNITDSNYLPNKAADILFPADRWGVDMAMAQENVAASLLANQQQWHAQWLNTVTSRLDSYRVPAPLESADSERPVLDLDPLVNHPLLQGQAQALQLRTSLSTAAAMAAAGQTLWRATSARSAAAAARAAATRATTSVTLRAGTAAASGGTVCAPAGPVAVGCAVVAGAAVWLASDWLLLQLDEIRNRDDLIAAMQAGLDELQVATAQELLRGSQAIVSAMHQDLASEIRNDFVPITRLQHQ